jgi:uncharacterized Rmd1/YagE family protein
MGCDLLDEGNFSAKEREILSKAGRILEMRVRAQSDVLDSPTLVRQWLRVRFSGLEQEMLVAIRLAARD